MIIIDREKWASNLEHEFIVDKEKRKTKDNHFSDSFDEEKFRIYSVYNDEKRKKERKVK